MSDRTIVGLILIFVGLFGIIIFLPYYGMNGIRLIDRPMIGDHQGSQYTDSSLITMEQAKFIAEQYLNSLNNPDLAIKEIMEFEYNFYVIFFEKSTEIGAFEMLIWKVEPSFMMGHGMEGYGNGILVGQIMPEPGPNMMWNTKYGGMMGHMRGGMMGSGMMGGKYADPPTSEMPIDEEGAINIGKKYLDEYYPGATIEESTSFYGYHTFDFGKDGKINGMFSVNGYNGQIWYHGWHGNFIGMEEYYEEHND